MPLMSVAVQQLVLAQGDNTALVAAAATIVQRTGVAIITRLFCVNVIITASEDCQGPPTLASYQSEERSMVQVTGLSALLAANLTASRSSAAR